MSYNRKDDTMIEQINNKIEKMDNNIDQILKILNGNGKIGVCAQVEINKNDIVQMKKKPVYLREWIIAGAVIFNTALVAYNFFK